MEDVNLSFDSKNGNKENKIHKNTNNEMNRSSGSNASNLEITARSLSARFSQMFDAANNVISIPGLDEPDEPQKVTNLNNSYISRGGGNISARRSSTVSDYGDRRTSTISS